MRLAIFILTLFQAWAILAQPVSHIRLISLQNPPDTTQQYVIQGGNGKDTIKWVPVDTLDISGGSGWLKDSLEAGRVAIDASNTLSLTSLDSFRVRATKILLWADDSLRLEIDSTNSNDELVINARFTIDKWGAIELANIAKTFDTPYSATAAGKMAYNNTDNVPMFRNTSGWVNLATEDDVGGTAGHTIEDEGSALTQRSVLNFIGDGVTAADAGVETTVTIPGESEGYALAETATADLQNIGTTWEALEAQTSPVNSTDWSFATGTDLFTYSGSSADKYLISFSVCAQFSTSTFREIRFTVQENGTDGNAKAVMLSGADSGTTDCASGFDIVTANNGDTFGLGMILDTGSATNVTIESSQLAITKLVGQ